MKIMQVITRSELGGAQTVVVQLANELSKNHDVVLVAGEGDGKMWDMVSPRVVREHCPHLQRKISLTQDLKAAIALRRIYKKHNPDVVHLHSSKAGTLGRLIFPTKKVVYTVHGFDSIRIAFRRFLTIERTLQHLCRAIVGVSNYDRKHLQFQRQSFFLTALLKMNLNSHVLTIFDILFQKTYDTLHIYKYLVDIISYSYFKR